MYDTTAFEREGRVELHGIALYLASLMVCINTD